MTRSPGLVESSIKMDWRTLSSPATSAIAPVDSTAGPRPVASATVGTVATMRDKPSNSHPEAGTPSALHDLDPILLGALHPPGGLVDQAPIRRPARRRQDDAMPVDPDEMRMARLIIDDR